MCWGTGYCDLDESQTRCRGDIRSCKDPISLKKYLHEPKSETAALRDARQGRRSPRLSISLPLEYRKRNGSCPQAAFSGDLSETSLLIYSIVNDLCVGEESKIRVFFASGYELDCFKVIARVIWKSPHVETDWKGYKYGLEVIHISRKDREKLRLLCSEEIPDYKGDTEVVDRPRASMA